MKYLLILVCVLVSNLYAQKNTFDFKQKFDELSKFHTSTKTYDYSLKYDPNWFYGWGFYLLSDIRMYEATGDYLNYLDPIITYSYEIQSKNKPTKKWYDEIPASQLLSYSGQVLRPMAEFIMLVKKDTILQKRKISKSFFEEHKLMNQKIDSNKIENYLDYCIWLEKQVINDVDYLTDLHWLDFEKGFTKDFSGWSLSYKMPAELNIQAAWVPIFYCLNETTKNHNYYLERGNTISQLFKNQLSIYEIKNSNPRIQNYTWFHNLNLAKKGGDLLYREDVSHGAVDLYIPLYSYQISPTKVFNLLDLYRFNKTFTYNIYDRINQTGFRNSVYGMNVPNLNKYQLPPQEYTIATTTSEKVNVNLNDNFYSLGEILPWISLFEFESENDSLTLYSILINHAQSLLENNAKYIPKQCPPNFSTDHLSGAQALYGLSEIVKAQWIKNGWSPNYCSIIQQKNEIENNTDLEESITLNNDSELIDLIGNRIYIPISNIQSGVYFQFNKEKETFKKIVLYK